MKVRGNAREPVIKSKLRILVVLSHFIDLMLISEQLELDAEAFGEVLGHLTASSSVSMELFRS